MSTTQTLETLYERIAERMSPGQLPIKFTASANGTTGSFITSSAIFSTRSIHYYDKR